MVETARIFDIGTIDFDAIIDRLISPTGLVFQFALDLEIQIIFVIGWVILGKYYVIPCSLYAISKAHREGLNITFKCIFRFF